MTDPDRHPMLALPLSVATDRALANTALRLLCMIVEQAALSDGRGCRLTNEELAERMGVGTRSVQLALRTLLGRSLVVRAEVVVDRATIRVLRPAWDKGAPS